jgi:hypothetical protein
MDANVPGKLFVERLSDIEGFMRDAALYHNKRRNEAKAALRQIMSDLENEGCTFIFK